MSPPEVPHSKTIAQNIKYIGTGSEFSTKILGSDVTVMCNEGTHTHGSSKVKLINKIDYNWEFNYYRGQLIAVHISGKIVAYGMKGKDGGMVRVTSQVTGVRTLIKNLKKDVRDVAFSISKQQIILGCIDDEGNVMIYEIFDEPTEIRFTLMHHIAHNPEKYGSPSDNYRIIWCPYIPSYEEEEGETSDDPLKMFVVLNQNRAEIWNCDLITSKDQYEPIEPNKDENGYVEVELDDKIVDASFSVDGTAIAFACNDGYVKFYQIYMSTDEKQTCLHQWRPHGNEPLSSIIFVDNLMECSQQCWKFTITGANNNTELKLWSCETWTCLQTIRFKPSPGSIIQFNFMKIGIDYRGQFLVLSDINSKVLYVLHLKRDDEAQQISVTMLSQFLLPTTFLSFHITEARLRNIPPLDTINSEEYPEQDDLDDDDDEEDRMITVILKMLVIQTKKFQECNIVFQPETMLYATEVVEKITNGEVNDEKVIPKLEDLQSSVTLLIKAQQQQQQQQQQQMTLMTPEAFTTEKPSPPNSVINEAKSETDLIDFQRPEKDNFASGGSSPSREVQEIMSLNNSTYSTQDYFDNLTKLQDDDPELPQKEFYDQENVANPADMALWLKLPISKDPSSAAKDETLVAADDEAKTQMQALNFRLTALESAINAQNLLLQKMQQELLDRAKSSKDKEAASSSTNAALKDIEVAMSKQQLNMAKMLESMMTMQKNKERDQNHMISGISQMVTKTVVDKVHMTVGNEMHNFVVPTIRNLLEALGHQLDMQNSQKQNSDKLLQEKIVNMFNSKTLAESLSQSVCKVMAPTLENLYRDMVTKTMVPSMDKLCGKMFSQMHDTFTRGTKEYTASIESYMDKQRRVQDRTKELTTQMQAATETLNEFAGGLSVGLMNDLQMMLNSCMKQRQEAIAQNVKEVISEEVKIAFKNHASVLEDSVISAVRSRAVTPSPHVETQITLSHIDQLLAKECYAEAIQVALSAENLHYVIYVCEKIDASNLFLLHCPPQNCILALIQQLSMELHKNTELKLSYIRTALVALKPNFPHTRQFIPKVLKDLLRQLQNFMDTNPNSKLIMDAKLLKMAVDNVLEK